MRRADRSQRIIIAVRLAEAIRDVLDGIVSFVKQNNLHWVIQCIDADEFVPMLKPADIDGAIAVISPNSRPLLRRVRNSGVPTVNMFHDVHPLLPSVLSDDRRIGAAAAEYFIQRGFRTFAFVGIRTKWSQSRCSGFQETILRGGHTCYLSPTCESVSDYHFMDTAAGIKVLEKWIAMLPKPLAVMACSDLVVRALLAACDRAGIMVPQQAAILGVDNRISLCELARVPLSSVMQDFNKLGFEAARLLHAAMSRGQEPPSAVLVQPSGIAARRSTEVLAFEDEYVSAAMRLIHDHAAGGISIKQLLRQVPVSRKWLDLRFKALLGHTPSREVRKARLATIRDLLLHTDLSIRQIARRCGFSNTENLIRFFRADAGMPPQRFRERQRT